MSPIAQQHLVNVLTQIMHDWARAREYAETLSEPERSLRRHDADVHAENRHREFVATVSGRT